MNRAALDQFVCPECRHAPLALRAIQAEGDLVTEGVLTCPGCGTWFRIEHGLADLLPRSLWRHDLRAAFATRHGLDASDGATDTTSFKARQISFFDSHAEDYEEQVILQPLQVAFGDLHFLPWLERSLRAGQRALDLGCGTGQTALYLAGHGVQVTGVDISEEMLRLAQRKAEKAGYAGRIAYVVGDAENPPVRDGSHHAAVYMGTLHHLPRPDQAILAVGHKLASGGVFYCQEPHRSPVRFLFDLLMKVWKLYDEEASESPLLGERQVLGWLAAAGLQGRTTLSIYVPPHAFRFLGNNGARRLLRATDRLFPAIGLRRWGGFLVVEGRKP